MKPLTIGTSYAVAFSADGELLVTVGRERTGRRARLIELDPIFVDVSVERWQRLTGGTARDCSNRGGVILDSFGGAGTTLICDL